MRVRSTQPTESVPQSTGIGIGDGLACVEEMPETVNSPDCKSIGCVRLITLCVIQTLSPLHRIHAKDCLPQTDVLIALPESATKTPYHPAEASLSNRSECSDIEAHAGNCTIAPLFAMPIAHASCSCSPASPSTQQQGLCGEQNIRHSACQCEGSGPDSSFSGHNRT